jgi:steroid 5-alpha reductase family enzyme
MPAFLVGLFTFIRSLCRGGDSRFEKYRTQPRKFFALFLLQGVWVTFCTLPIVALNSIPSNGFTGDGWRTPDNVSILTGLYRRCWFWIGMWSFLRGFVIECLADWQLSKWRWDRYRKRHNEVFCGRGLWDRR